MYVNLFKLEDEKKHVFSLLCINSNFQIVWIGYLFIFLKYK
jgi:hypothetical protein